MNNWQKILIGAVSVLFVLNILLIGLIWTHRPGQRPERNDRGTSIRMGKHLIQNLKFNDQQKNQFIMLSDRHKVSMRELMKAQHQSRIALHRAVIGEDTTEISRRLTLLNNSQLAINAEMVEFFSQVASICNEDQKQLFRNHLDGSMQHFEEHDRPGLKRRIRNNR
ncbi:MAG: periplasmic heavy metal sensor [Cyclobacteriaceae bacterium]